MPLQTWGSVECMFQVIWSLGVGWGFRASHNLGMILYCSPCTIAHFNSKGLDSVCDREEQGGRAGVAVP
jgi:hypothetical protein